MCRRPCTVVPAHCAELQAHSEIPTGALATGLWLQGGRTGPTNKGQGGKTAQMGLHHQTCLVAAWDRGGGSPLFVGQDQPDSVLQTQHSLAGWDASVTSSPSSALMFSP